ncbi:MAG: sensor histidine kinase [Actinobacteria bacterium]|nr:sensor histidine kinase [Actinomycetota bacterium]
MTGLQVGLAFAAGVPGVLVGLFLLVRGPRVVGVLLILLGLLPLVLLSPDSGVAGGVPPHGFALVLAVMSVAGWVWFYVPPALLAAYFPDGRLGRRWWVLTLGWAVFVVLFHLAVAIDPRSYGDASNQIPGAPPVDVPGWVSEAVGFVSLALLLGLLVGSAARVVVRFRGGDGVVRLQIKWFLLSFTLLPAVLVVTWAAYLLTDVAGVVVVVGLLVVYVSLPVSIAIAILRHDLYDIDTLVSRAAGYTLLTGLVVAVYSALTVGIGAMVGRGSELTVAAATLAGAAVFGLLRRRVQAGVDARFDRGRGRALARMDRFLDEIRQGRAEPEQVEQVLRGALADPGIAVRFRMGNGATTTWHAVSGEVAARPEGLVLDVAVAGRNIGCIGYDLARRRPRLFRDVLRRAHLALELAHSRMALRQALIETRASRQRLVEATDAERRRIERDLHDGAQQRLVAIGMRLRLAQQVAGPADPLQTAVGDAVGDLQEAIAELRSLAGGVRPQGLDEGLPTALRALTRTSPVPVVLHVTVAPVSDAVATTAYYVAAEALANALKHADPRVLTIDVAQDDGTLTVRVCDDGRGGAVVTAGSGLAGLRDRVEALGGSLSLDSRRGIGTRVEARLPCGS